MSSEGAPAAPTGTPAAPARVIVIEGEIGAGKSTFLDGFANHLEAAGYRVGRIQEPVDEWKKDGTLALFYEDMKANAYVFQTHTFTTRIKACRKVLAEQKDADVFLLERCIFADKYIFMALQEGSMDPRVVACYDSFFDMWSELMPFNLKTADYVYLKPSLPTCMKRVTHRARKEEIRPAESLKADKKDGVTSDYQSLLRAQHEALLEGKGQLKSTCGRLLERPFPLEAVITVGGDEADGDFLTPGPGRTALFARVASRLGLDAAAPSATGAGVSPAAGPRRVAVGPQPVAGMGAAPAVSVKIQGTLSVAFPNGTQKATVLGTDEPPLTKKTISDPRKDWFFESHTTPVLLVNHPNTECSGRGLQVDANSQHGLQVTVAPKLVAQKA